MNGLQRERVLLNVGCGPRSGSLLPGYFDGWQHRRVDIDASVQPDIIADLTDLSPIADGSADAVWAAHCIDISTATPGQSGGRRISARAARGRLWCV